MTVSTKAREAGTKGVARSVRGAQDAGSAGKAKPRKGSQKGGLTKHPPVTPWFALILEHSADDASFQLLQVLSGVDSDGSCKARKWLRHGETLDENVDSCREATRFAPASRNPQMMKLPTTGWLPVRWESADAQYQQGRGSRKVAEADSAADQASSVFIFNEAHCVREARRILLGELEPEPFPARQAPEPRLLKVCGTEKRSHPESCSSASTSDPKLDLGFGTGCRIKPGCHDEMKLRDEMTLKRDDPTFMVTVLMKMAERLLAIDALEMCLLRRIWFVNRALRKFLGDQCFGRLCGSDSTVSFDQVRIVAQQEVRAIFSAAKDLEESW